MISASAIRECHAVIAHGSKSFALASKILPQPARDYAAVIYTWCRRADDAVDCVPPEQQGKALATLHSELDVVYSDEKPSHLVLAAFQEVTRTCGIPEDYPRALLDGMQMDVEGHRYDGYDDLLLYCYRVASTVGLMMCHVMGLADSQALGHAAHLGIAMQLTNISRDVAEDWSMGRLYIPRELLNEVGAGDLPESVAPNTTIPTEHRDAIARATEQLLGLAADYYRSGDEGLVSLSWRCSLAIRAARFIYAAIGERIEEQRFDVLSGRAFVPTRDKLRLIVRAATAEARTSSTRLQRWLTAPPSSSKLPAMKPSDVVYL